jgi:hypothetical protein
MGPPPGTTGYSISRSLRFNSSDSAYLSRTPASAGTSRTTWTISLWLKRAALGTAQWIFFSSDLTANTTAAYFTSSDTLEFYEFQSGSYVARLITTQVFRDTSAWYHFTFTWDTTNGTSSDRVRIYVNGQRIENFSTNTYPSSSVQSRWNNNVLHYFSRGVGSEYFSGYLAECIFVDGTALTPSSFTEPDATTGQLIPKAFSGSYGTNGFKLTFSDNSTAAALGTDTSGNGNTWTVNNLSVTAGAGNDSLVDVPTNGAQTDTGVGGEVRGNYAVLNPLNYTGTVTLSNGNLDATGSNANASSTIAPNAGKWYAEFVYSAIGAAVGFVGISNRLGADAFSGATQTWQLNYTNTGKLENAGSQSNVSTFTTGDIIGVAFDCSNGQATFYKNGSSVGTITGSAFVGVPVLIGAGAGGAAGTNTFTANFGQRPFAYTAPSGFKALNTANLPAPLVTKPSTVMDVALYTGNGSARSITGLGFNPDLVWIKSRSAATDHELTDSVRGTTKSLSSNLTAAEATDTGGLTAFNSDGFSLGTDTKYNNNAATYAAWAWDAGSSTVTNTQGSITSTVRANQTAGFSVVTFNSGSNGIKSAGHGLGVAPSLILFKERTNTGSWITYHRSLATNKYLALNSTNGEMTSTNDVWGGSGNPPTSTTFSFKTGEICNASADCVCYCFAPVVGYTSISSYTGNGSSDGVFVYTGMRPRFIMIKRTDTTSNWTIIDTAREGYNVDNDPLYPNLSDAEGTTDLADILSNGFKLRSSDASVNASSGTYIYAAFAESPFNYSRAR